MHQDRDIYSLCGLECPTKNADQFLAKRATCEECLKYASYKVKYHIDLATADSSHVGGPDVEAQFLPSMGSEFGGRKWRNTVAINVLVVDDEEELRDLLVDVLRANGYCRLNLRVLFS